MSYGSVEGFQSLTCKRPSAPVTHRHRYNHWDIIDIRFINLYRADGSQCCFDVQGIEAGFDEQEVGAAADEGLGLLAICIEHIVKGIGPVCRVSGVR